MPPQPPAGLCHGCRLAWRHRCLELLTEHLGVGGLGEGGVAGNASGMVEV